MPSLKDIKSRIKSIQTTQKTTKAMKMVSAAKMRKAQDNLMRLRPYAAKLNELMFRVIASLEGAAFSSPYAEERPVVNKVLVVVVASNRGLAGAFNSAICKQGLATIQEKFADHHAQGKLEVLAIGKRAFDFFKKRGFKMVQDRNFDVYVNLNSATVLEVSDMVMNGFLNGEWDRVELVFNEFKNVMSQSRISEQFLPVQVPTEADIKPADYIYEPGREEILTSLIPMILQTRFYRAILESNLGEHAARMMAMDNATENANDLLIQLRLVYNKARQASITKELIEIVSGAEALNA